MKKLNLLRLIASLCLFLGTFITFVNTVTEIPTVLHYASLPLLLAALVLYVILFVKQIIEKSKSKNEEEDEDDEDFL